MDREDEDNSCVDCGLIGLSPHSCEAVKYVQRLPDTNVIVCDNTGPPWDWIFENLVEGEIDEETWKILAACFEGFEEGLEQEKRRRQLPRS